ncbi:MAG: hypothetical protein P4L50_00240 [Anaerolineaceae bacterium]|nr:hypothetical protein [Anaerolineaceae bacterium]
MDEFERLHMLLNLAEKLMGHPKYMDLNSYVAHEIAIAVDVIKKKPTVKTPEPVALIEPTEPELPIDPLPNGLRAIPTRRVYDGLPGPAEPME